jgi:glucose-6-phosphate isomerase
MQNFSTHFGKYDRQINDTLQQLQKERCLERIADHDYTLWKDKPAEITNRLGWLKSPEVMISAGDEINQFTADVRAAGLKQVLLLGMGGSSLAPEVYSRAFGTKAGYLELSILDSTDPGSVLARDRSLDLEHTLFIVATKSGGTVETFSFMKYFYNRIGEAVGKKKAGEHFVAITDGGSGLEMSARELKFRKIFLNDPEIGGRYSALSYFGLVPASLMGIDIKELLIRAQKIKQTTFSGSNTDAFKLGVAMGVLAGQGIDKLTLLLTPLISSFGAWIEQLVAESTGKEGKGILPIDREELLTPELYSPDRLFVYLRLAGDEHYDDRINNLIDAGKPLIRIDLHDVYDLAVEIFRWELATAVAGVVLGINPFDQPNVESAKVLARQMVSTFHKTGKPPEITSTLLQNGLKIYAGTPAATFAELIASFLAGAQTRIEKSVRRSYLSLQAYLPPSAEIDRALQELRNKIQLKYSLATTVGYGPRFLHSTGQLHKGDGGHGLFIQLLADMPEDVPIPDVAGKPDSSISFGILKNSQALGDRQALLNAGRKVITIDLGMDILKGIKILWDVL